MSQLRQRAESDSVTSRQDTEARRAALDQLAAELAIRQDGISNAEAELRSQQLELRLKARQHDHEDSITKEVQRQQQAQLVRVEPCSSKGAICCRLAGIGCHTAVCCCSISDTSLPCV